MSESQTRLPAAPGPEATHDARRLYEWDLLLRTCGEPAESDWVPRKTRVAEDFVVHQVPLHTHSLGEPLTASMTSTALEWELWPALTSAMCWGAIEE